MPVLKPLPYRPLRPSRRLPGKDVTLVAGFRCKNGVVLCADTEHTGQYIKFVAPKVWTDRNRVIVAGACTDVVYLKMAVDEVIEQFENLTQWTESSVRKVISDAIGQVYKAIRKGFDMKDRDRPQLFLMVAVRLDDWKAILIKTAETAVALVDEFDFIGSGDELARLLMSPFYDGNLRVTEMQTIAAYCFRYAKATGSFCGGNTHIGVVFDGDPDAHYAHPAYVNHDRETVTDHILSGLAPALSAAWNVNVDREEFEHRLTNLTSGLRVLRERQEKVSRPDVFISNRPKPSK